MLDAPRQNWEAFRNLTAAHDRQFARDLSVAERFACYEDLFDLIWSAPRTAEERERMDKSLWQQKLVLRKKQIRAFHSLE